MMDDTTEIDATEHDLLLSLASAAATWRLHGDPMMPRILDATGGSIATVHDVSVAALLLRAPEVEQAARECAALIEEEFGELGPPVIQEVKERLLVALGDAK